MSDNNFFHLWPTILARFDNPYHNEIKEGLIDFFKEIRNKNPAGRKSHENNKLYESTYDMHSNNNRSYQELIKFFQTCFLKSSLYSFNTTVKNEKLNADDKFKVSITNSWFIEYEKGGSVLPHTHGNCSWCCVYYVQIDESSADESGNTYFVKPFSHNNLDDFGSFSYNSYTSFSYKPKEGQLLIWPSYLVHGSVASSADNNKRIIVSANAKIFKI